MASELTVYENIFADYSSENKFWGVFLFFLKLLFYFRGFQNTNQRLFHLPEMGKQFLWLGK